MDANDFIDGVILDVSELPDRTSPAGFPDAMIVTAAELRTIIEKRLVDTALHAILDADEPFTCEDCSKEIKAGDKYAVTLDGCYLCERDAPSFQDAVDFWHDHKPDGEYEEEAAEGSIKALAGHIAAGGSPDDKPLMVME